MDNTRWPAALNWVIPGTPEFAARYTAGDTAGGEPVIAGTGCTAAHGGDAYRYTVDFFTHLGAVLDAQATATGHGVMTLGDQPLPTAPWPGLATDRGTTVGTLGSGEKVMATPGALIPMPASGAALAGGAGVCADTLRAYGTPAADAPFGFGFYTAPDQGSVDFLTTQLAAQQDRPAGVPGETRLGQPRPVLRPGHRRREPAPHLGFLPAAGHRLLHRREQPVLPDRGVPALPGRRRRHRHRTGGDHRLPHLERQRDHPQPGHRDDPDHPGGGGPRRRGLRPAATRSPVPGSRRRWTGGPRSRSPGKPSPRSVKMLYVTLGAGALVGGLVAGGIPGLLLAAGVIGVAALVVSQGIFGAVSCAEDFPKCLAAGGADGLVKTLALIPAAAGSTDVPDMTGPSMTALLSTLGGISAALVLVFFLISLLAAAVMQRPGADLARVLRPGRVGRRDGVGRCAAHHAHRRPRRGDDLAEHRRRRNRAGRVPGRGEGQPDRDRRRTPNRGCCSPVCCRCSASAWVWWCGSLSGCPSSGSRWWWPCWCCNRRAWPHPGCPGNGCPAGSPCSGRCWAPRWWC